MDLGFDTPPRPNRWPQSRRRDGAEGCAPARLDWPGLRARFLAARACRLALEGESAGLRAGAGSFDRAAALALAHGLALAGETSPAVNPTALANGKAREGKDEGVADALAHGDRG